MALKIFLEPSQLDVARHTVTENSNYFAEIGIETVRPAKEKETKSSAPKEGLSNTEKITVTSEKPLVISKCGYNASSFNNISTSYLYGILKIKL